MLNRTECIATLIDIIQNNITKKVFRKAVNYNMKLNHDVLSGRTNQLLLCDKNILNDATDEELFWICRETERATNANGLFSGFFTHSEIGKYSNSKAKKNKDDLYPVVFTNAIQVAYDQWVTSINIDDLMDMYSKQIIRYNKETQRPTIRTEKNGLVQYKISINKKSVDEITNLMKNGLFIPNAITLNINVDDANNSFHYINGNLFLDQGSLDIIDGFHRYLSLVKCKQDDDSFNYNMIVNIMNFTTEKALSYIAQEDKRNKINKSVVKTMDSNNVINILISRLNESGYLRGKIGRGDDYPVNSITLFSAIEKCYNIKTNADEIELRKKLQRIINAVYEDGFTEFDFLSIVTLIKASQMYDEDIEKIERMLNAKKYLPDKVNRLKAVSKYLLDEIEKLDAWVK